MKEAMFVRSVWLGILNIYSSNILLVAVKTKKLNSMAWVRERTIPTKRPPLVGEVIANLCG
jgi:hypothetical protein